MSLIVVAQDSIRDGDLEELKYVQSRRGFIKSAAGIMLPALAFGSYPILSKAQTSFQYFSSTETSLYLEATYSTGCQTEQETYQADTRTYSYFELWNYSDQDIVGDVGSRCFDYLGVGYFDEPKVVRLESMTKSTVREDFICRTPGQQVYASATRIEESWTSFEVV